MKKNEKNQIEKMLCQLCIGILTSLLKNKITIREAQQLLFSPFTSQYLKRKKISEELIDIIDYGCELEDIESLLPDKLEKKILQLTNKTFTFLKKMPEIDYQIDTWFSYLNIK